MRYLNLQVVGLMGVLIGWAQVTPWPLSKWALYAVQNGQPVAPPLLERAFVWPRDTLLGVVDTVGMGAAGIIRWRWTVQPSFPATGFFPPPSFPPNEDSILFTAGNRLAHSAPPFLIVGLWVVRAVGDSAFSYRLLQVRRNWGTLSQPYYWACPGGEARVTIDFMTTDVDSIRVWVEKGAVRYDSLLTTRPIVWRFTAPAVADTYTIRGWIHIRGRSVPLEAYTFAPASLIVSPGGRGGTCRLVVWGRACVGQPIEAWVEYPADEGQLPQQIEWDFTGDGMTDATGRVGRYTYSTPGTYPITATVRWNSGCSQVLNGSVVVEPSASLSAPTLLAPGSYALGTPVQVQLNNLRGVISVDWEDNGTWEGVADWVTGNSYRTPPYSFSTAPPPGGYPIRVKQEFCGTVREDVVYWNPTTTAVLTPDGVIEGPSVVFCPGDSVTLRVRPLAYFLPGQAGYEVAWNFGTSWTGPSSTAVETTFTWSGQPLSVRAQLYHPSGGTRIIGPLSINLPAAAGPAGRFTQVVWEYPDCPHDWCPPRWGDEVSCGQPRQHIRLRLVQRPRQAGSWRWRLFLPTDTLAFPSTAIPEDGYSYLLPAASGLYAVESRIETNCAVWREVWLFRVEDQGTGRPGGLALYYAPCGAFSTANGYGPEAILPVCAGEQVWINDIDGFTYGGGGFQGIDVRYANGQRPEIIRDQRGGISFRAPTQAGTYLLYVLWHSCGGRIDTTRYQLEVRASTAPSFTAPRWGCVGQPITFERQGPIPLRDNPTAGLRWDFGDGTIRTDSSLSLTHTYSAAGFYTINLTAYTLACGRKSFTRPIHIAGARPAVRIITATLVNGVLTYQGEATEADSVVWDFGDGNTAINVLSGTHPYGGNGPYRVRLYAFNGCGGSMAEVQVTWLAQGELGGWRIYPNPAQAEVWVEVPPGEGGLCRFYTVTGQEVKACLLSEGLNRIEVSALPRGLYVLQVVGRERLFAARLLLE